MPLPAVSDPAPAPDRERYDALSAALASRKSTLHFAHAGVALVVTVILTGTSARLFWKGNPEHHELAWAVGIFASVVFAYASARVGVGLARLKVELKDFAALKALRHQLGLDDPARLIPR